MHRDTRQHADTTALPLVDPCRLSNASGRVRATEAQSGVSVDDADGVPAEECRVRRLRWLRMLHLCQRSYHVGPAQPVPVRVSL